MSAITPTPPAPPATPPAAPAQPPASPPVRGSSLALRIGAVVTGLLIIVAALNLFSLMSGHTSANSQETFAAPGTALSIAADSADVTVVAGSDQTLKVVRHATAARGRTVPQPFMADGVLHLPGNCHGSFVGWLVFCSVRYTVQVPSGLPLDVRSSSGDVAVHNLSASTVSVRADSGDVSVSAVDSPTFVAKAGSGDIDIHSLTSPDAKVETGSGDVHVEFAQDPTALTASTGSGDLTVTVPADGSPYVVNEHRGSGDLDNGLHTLDRTTPAGSATRVLDVSTGSGDLTLRYAG